MVVFVVVLVVEVLVLVVEDEEMEYVGSLGCDFGFLEDVLNINVFLFVGVLNGFFDRVVVVVVLVVRFGFVMLLSGICCLVIEDCKLKMVLFDVLLGWVGGICGLVLNDEVVVLNVKDMFVVGMFVRVIELIGIDGKSLFFVVGFVMVWLCFGIVVCGGFGCRDMILIWLVSVLIVLEFGLMLGFCIDFGVGLDFGVLLVEF